MLEAIFSFNTLWWILMLIFVPSCLALIIMVLLQQGKGSGFGGAFGAGAGPGADTVFGPKGAQSVPVKITYVLATIFMIASISMSLIAGRLNESAAPELVEGGDGTTTVTATSSELAERGLGTGIVNHDPNDPASSPIESTPDNESGESVIQDVSVSAVDGDESPVDAEQDATTPKESSDETTIEDAPAEESADESVEESPNANN